MRYDNIPNSLFINNRKRLVDLLPNDCLAIFTSNTNMPTNGDGTMGFSQNSAMFYLTGIEQEDTNFIIYKPQNGKNVEEILFIRESNDFIKKWEGEKISKVDAKTTSGIESIKWSDTFKVTLDIYFSKTNNIFCHLDEVISKVENFKSSERLLIDELKERFPLHAFSPSYKLLVNLRLIKQPEELEQIRKAIETTHRGIENAAKAVKPGVYEYEIEAELSYAYSKGKSRFHAFQPIVASGKNACVLHYISNNNICIDGHVILIDTGAEYANYKADITRVFPVNGKFSHRQREVYEAVLWVLKESEKLIMVGNTLEKLKVQCNAIMLEALQKLGLIIAEVEKEKQISKYFPHGVSHFLGLDVHDVGTKQEIFREGMVLTCEPGIYIEEEGLGIRLENDILITENGNENLSVSIPIEIIEIENLMKI